MDKRFLGIDTSNYRTSAAIYHQQTGAWQNEGSLLSVPKGTIGLRQADALFQHTVRLHEKIAALPAENICAIGVSSRPRAVQDSYMPCFLAGMSVAQSAAHLLSVPLFMVSHQQGHVAAAALSANKLDLLERPFLSWHLSGGTTELLLVSPDEKGLPNCEILGGTNDLSAGQLLDRTAALLGFDFPGGAEVDKLAKKESGQKGYKIKVQNGMFSLSGMQNKIEEKHRKGEKKELVARFALDTIANAVITATIQAKETYDYPVLCAGGVMASEVIRERMAGLGEIYFAEPVLSGDNAVGVAVLAARLFERTSK